MILAWTGRSRVLLHRAKQAFKAVYLKKLPAGITGTAAD